jgi:hypothetical protein
MRDRWVHGIFCMAPVHTDVVPAQGTKECSNMLPSLLEIQPREPQSQSTEGGHHSCKSPVRKQEKAPRLGTATGGVTCQQFPELPGRYAYVFGDKNTAFTTHSARVRSVSMPRGLAGPGGRDVKHVLLSCSRNRCRMVSEQLAASRPQHLYVN